MITQGSPLKVDDLFEQAKIHLSDEAVSILSQPARTKQIYKYDDGRVEMCAYYGKQVKKSAVQSGIQSVASKLNQLTAEGSLKGHLAQMVSIDLSPEFTGYFNEDGTPKELECLILSYVFLPEDIYRREMEIAHKEGPMASLVEI